ncbi:MAG TPA: hypothetical protein VJP45_07315 [Candidatus Limnocylindria bacterium]|nr:hypothetical protein [Candidatus Limnocylindria bacterium]
MIEKQPVSPLDAMVLCPIKLRYIELARCLDCARLIGVDEERRTRYVVCDVATEPTA